MLLAGCSTSKYIPENAYLLEGVEIHSDQKNFNVSTLAPYIRQKANSKWFSLFKIPLGAYSISGRDSTKWINRTLKKMGEAPVIFDSTQARLSVEDLRNALKNMGYMHASVDLATKTRGKKLTAIYNLHPGKPYTINEVSYDIEDPAIARILRNYSRNLTKKGKRIDILTKNSAFTLQKLDDERKRITDILLDSRVLQVS